MIIFCTLTFGRFVQSCIIFIIKKDGNDIPLHYPLQIIIDENTLPVWKFAIQAGEYNGEEHMLISVEHMLG
jgi:hypothetical protein